MSATLALLSILSASRIFIATGAPTEEKAKAAAGALKLPRELRLSTPPKVIDSATVKGLKPGFFVVVLGTCREETADESRYADGLAALIQRSVKGAYAKRVEVTAAPAECPLWLPDSGEKVKAALKAPLDAKAVLEAAMELDTQGDLIAATAAARRAVALDPKAPGAVDFLRKVELISEDLPNRLP
jgi:hypothetical protein